jgi:hypothetical protein
LRKRLTSEGTELTEKIAGRSKRMDWKAILAYRKLTNLGANEAQIAVEKIERGVSSE